MEQASHVTGWTEERIIELIERGELFSADVRVPAKSKYPHIKLYRDKVDALFNRWALTIGRDRTAQIVQQYMVAGEEEIARATADAIARSNVLAATERAETEWGAMLDMWMRYMPGEERRKAARAKCLAILSRPSGRLGTEGMIKLMAERIKKQRAELISAGIEVPMADVNDPDLPLEILTEDELWQLKVQSNS